MKSLFPIHSPERHRAHLTYSRPLPISQTRFKGLRTNTGLTRISCFDGREGRSWKQEGSMKSRMKSCSAILGRWARRHPSGVCSYFLPQRSSLVSSFLFIPDFIFLFLLCLSYCHFLSHFPSLSHSHSTSPSFTNASSSSLTAPANPPAHPSNPPSHTHGPKTPGTIASRAPPGSTRRSPPKSPACQNFWEAREMPKAQALLQRGNHSHKRVGCGQRATLSWRGRGV